MVDVKKIIIIFFFSLFCFSFLIPNPSFSEAVVGDVIVTLGEDLTEQQKQQLLKEMNILDDSEVIFVTNQEEQKYLGEYISKQQIGTRAISSTKITLMEQGSGINVTTNNITWVSEGMYANALATAGIENADVYVTAPFEVSGTAGLTGVIKAYEISTEIEIPEEQKKVANEEMVRTAELGDRLGFERATELMTRIKEEIAQNPVTSDMELRELIQNVANELGITLTDEELNGLASLFQRMKDLNIDWDKVQNQITNIRENLGEFLNREETQSFLGKILDVIIEFINVIKGWLTTS